MLWFLALPLLLAPVDSGSATLKRFVLVAGANDGGTDRVPLRYAVSDAENFVGVLQSMGGVRSEDVILIQEATRASLDAALSELRQRVADTNPVDTRREVIVYYSGHADEQGLLLGDARFTYQDLRSRVDSIDADVRITVLDACASGAITRLKGGERRQAFLVDESSHAKGYAFLTSSSEDEAAQESDRIGASYFTHYLVSGLRGAADASADGKVTLNEAYQFAFHETLATTSKSQAGAQHPAYDISLAGAGDVVMTDVTQISASLRFGEALHGRLYIRNSNQQLVAEVFKTVGRVMELGLEPDLYEVTFEQTPGRYKMTLDLEAGQRREVKNTDMMAFAPESTVSRGGRTASQGGRFSLLWNENFDSTGVQASLAYNVSRGKVGGFQLSAGLNHAAGEIDGMQIGGINIARKMRGLQIGLVNLAEDLDGVAIGAINYSKTGIFETTVWIDAERMTYVTLMSGSRWWYTSYTLGYNRKEETQPFVFGGGVGARFRKDRFSVDVGAEVLGVLARTYTRNPRTGGRPNNILSTYRGVVGTKVWWNFSVVVGASLNVLYLGDHPPLISPATPSELSPASFFGFMGGIRFGRD